MELGRRVGKYQLTASFHQGLVAWTLTLETDGGERFALPIKDGEEVPILLDICQADASLFYDAETRTLSTGWNDPGKHG